jgi:CheY-like chemotaxis protein
MLESLGLCADVAANGREALEMFRLAPYDLILMDCEMPLMNGKDATREIRKSETPDRHTAIVAMSIDPFETGPDRYLDCGMDDILGKPVRMEELMRALDRWLPENRTETSAPLAPEPSLRG